MLDVIGGTKMVSAETLAGLVKIGAIMIENGEIRVNEPGVYGGGKSEIELLEE